MWHVTTPAIYHAAESDLPAVLALQYRAFESEAALVGDWSIPPLTQTLAELTHEWRSGIVLKAVDGQKIIGSVRAHAKGGTLFIGKLTVENERQGQGIGAQLLAAIERACPQPRYELFTSSLSLRNLGLYARVGYHVFGARSVSTALQIVYLQKHAQ